MKPTPIPRRLLVGLNFSSLALLTGLLLFPALSVRAQSEIKPLTQEQLLEQIESLDPQKNDPLTAAPASVAQPPPKTSGPAAAAKMRASTPPPEALGNATDKAPKVEKKSKGPTEIVALEATFDQKAHLAVFIGQVVVTDPEFNVQCDRLTAYLKQDKAAAGPSSTPMPAPRLTTTTPAPVKAEGKKDSTGGLEKAIAEADPGRIVVIHQDKKEADGSISKSIGRATKAVYVSTTGDITLTGRPEVQQAINTCIATDDSTVMVLNRDGHMRVNGPHKTVIRDQGDLTK